MKRLQRKKIKYDVRPFLRWLEMIRTQKRPFYFTIICYYNSESKRRVLLSYTFHMKSFYGYVLNQESQIFFFRSRNLSTMQIFSSIEEPFQEFKYFFSNKELFHKLKLFLMWKRTRVTIKTSSEFSNYQST